MGLAALGMMLNTFKPTHIQHLWPLQGDSPGAGQWTMFANTPSHNAVIEQGPTHRFRVSWTRRLSQPLMQASLVRGVLYAGGIGQDPKVYAINALNGKTLWKTPVNNQVMTTPIVYDGMVFIGTGNHNFPYSHVPKYGVKIIRGSGPSAIFALNARTGAVLWKHSTHGEDMPTPVYQDRSLYVVNGADELLDLNPLTGQVMWKLSLPSYVSMSSPTVEGHILYFGGSHPSAIYAVNLNTHHIKWMHTLAHPMGGSDDVPPAVGSGMVYFDYVKKLHRRPHTMVYALNARNGHKEWGVDVGAGSIPLGPHEGPRDETGVPTIQGTRLYVASPITHTFYVFNRLSGSLAFAVHFKSGITQGPVVYHGVCYFGDGHGNFYAINATNGRIEAHKHFQGAFMPSTPILAGKTVLTSDRAGQVMAISLPRL